MLRRLLIPAAVAVTVVAVIVIAISSDNDVPEDSVASIAGESITKKEFDRWFDVIAASQQDPRAKRKPKPPKPGSQEYESLKDQALQFLISTRWIELEADDRGIKATDSEVKRQFEQTRDQSFPSKKEYEKFLKSSGQTEDDIMARVKVDLLSNKIREKITEDTEDVSDGDIEDYYEKNKDQFSQPERRDLRVVATKKEEEAEEARRRIEKGESFAKVAKDMSTDPTSKDQGGKLLGVQQGQQDPALETAAFNAIEGKLIGPVKTGSGYYILKLTKVTPASQQGLEESKESIRQLIVSQKQQQALDRFTQTFQRKWRDDTNCREGFVTSSCSNGEQAAGPGAVPGQPAPVPGSSGQAPAALDGTGSPPVGAPGGAQAGASPLAPGGAAGTDAPPALGGVAEEDAQQAAPAVPGMPATPGAAPTPSGTNLPPALGGAPSEQAQPGALPPGAAPQAAPPPGG